MNYWSVILHHKMLLKTTFPWVFTHDVNHLSWGIGGRYPETALNKQNKGPNECPT